MPASESTPENAPLLPDDKNKDRDGNEITLPGKIFSGLMLIIFTILSSLGIIAYWPDRLPEPDEKCSPLYIHQWFHIRLACVTDTVCDPDNIYYPAVEKPKPAVAVADTSISGNDSIAGQDTADSITTDKPVPELSKEGYPLIHINTLLLILVALGGFLGNMIHIATSFTTFLGAGKFKRSWTLWYWVKPFTASALAIGIYFVFRGGFLNMSDGGASINLYGLMTISIFAGLFTDKATEKLKEIFEVLFRAKEERPDPISGKFKISSISPLIIVRGKENLLTITGEKLDTEKLLISVDGEPVADTKVSVSSITFSYTIPDLQKDKSDFTVSVKDEKGKEHYKAVLTAKDAPGDVTPAEDANTDEQGLG
jgi:IPT/TIG domain